MRSVFYPSRTQSGTNAASSEKGGRVPAQAGRPGPLRRYRKLVKKQTTMPAEQTGATSAGGNPRQKGRSGEPDRHSTGIPAGAGRIADRQPDEYLTGNRTDTRQETGRIPDRKPDGYQTGRSGGKAGNRNRSYGQNKRRLRSIPQPSYLSGISRANRAGHRWPRPYTSIYARRRPKRPTR